MKTKELKNKKIIKEKRPKKKKLGMGLSSLLSKDDELTSVIKAKISKKIDENKIVGKRRPTLGRVLKSKNNPLNLQTTNSQTMMPIQNLVSGKFQPR